MAKYLITGGCGFIGSHLSDRLLEQGHEVIILDNLSTGKKENISTQCQLIIGDIVNKETVEQAMANVDGCYHLAAIASTELSNKDWQGTHAINQTGTINIYNAARPSKIPVIYASSAAIYGDNNNLPLKETENYKPMTAYGADKAGCELHARIATLVHQVPTLGFRFFNVYGPRQDPSSPYSGVISIFADRILQNQAITIFGDGQQTRDFIYVADVVNHLMAGMSSQNKHAVVLNVCTSITITVAQLAKHICDITGNQVAFEFKPPRLGDIKLSQGDPAQAIKILNVRTEMSIEEGLKKTIEFIKTQS